MRIHHFVVVLLASAASSPAGAQTHQHEAVAAPVQLGTVSFPNSGNTAAQAPFIRGMKLLHNFQYEDAVTAFQEAEKADPDFALAYWGEAMSHNYTLWSEQHTDEARRVLAKFAPTREARADKVKTRREREWLDTAEVLYGPGTKFERDVAFSDRMDALAKKYPDDVEAQVFAALALLGRSHGTRDVAQYEAAGARLERLFKRFPQHPGIAHYLIHSYDDPAHAAKGLAAARVYDRLAPASAHAQHMTSHIFLALGMWPETERANVNARRAQEERAEPNHASACGHGGIWLVYARLQQGKSVNDNINECGGAVAGFLAHPVDEPPVAGDFEGGSGSHADMRARNFIETGELLLRLNLPEGKLNVARFVYDYADVLAARHDGATAAAAFDAMKKTHALLAANYRKEHPEDDQTMPWVDLMLLQAKGVTALAEGQQSAGMAILRDAAAREAALPAVFGPPALPKPGWELLGDELLAAGDKAGAAAAYKQSLALQPGRRLSLQGLSAATAF